MKVTHTHTMRGTLLVIVDCKYTYEVSRSDWSSQLQIKGDRGAIELSKREEAKLKRLYWESDAARL